MPFVKGNIYLNTGRTRFKKGLTPWNKDKKGIMPDPWNKGTKGLMVAWNKIDSDIKCDNCGIVFHRKPSHIKKNNYCSVGCRIIGMKKIMGTKEMRDKIRSIHFKGITPLKKLLKNTPEYRNWRKQVFERDNYACKKCGITGGCGHRVILHPHHKKAFSVILKEFLQQYSQFSPLEDIETLLRLAVSYKPFWEVDNGDTICKDCHKETENYGLNINKQEDLNEKNICIG